VLLFLAVADRVSSATWAAATRTARTGRRVRGSASSARSTWSCRRRSRIRAALPGT